MKNAFIKAFPVTIPVMLGYLFIGIAFGLLIENTGFNFLWAALISATVFAGSMQFVMVNFFNGPLGLLEVGIITLLVNFRHIVYGLSFIEKFKKMGKKKLYMIYSLTDETYALLCSSQAPAGVDSHSFYFAVALLNHSYWIIGSIIGATAGSLLTFNTKGVDFAMTALFAVICTEQWLSFPTHWPAVIGVGCTLLSLWIFGAGNMLLPAMIGIMAIMLATEPNFKKHVIQPSREV